jgi:hypothetical protein
MPLDFPGFPALRRFVLAASRREIELFLAILFTVVDCSGAIGILGRDARP